MPFYKHIMEVQLSMFYACKITCFLISHMSSSITKNSQYHTFWWLSTFENGGKGQICELELKNNVVLNSHEGICRGRANIFQLPFTNNNVFELYLVKSEKELCYLFCTPKTQYFSRITSFKKIEVKHINVSQGWNTVKIKNKHMSLDTSKTCIVIRTISVKLHLIHL